MTFFRNFPKTNYDFLGNGVHTRIIDIFRFVKPSENFKDELALYSYYEISEGDRPDVVSQKLYGTPEYYWTFFIINESLKNGLDGWPRSYNEQQDYIEKKYDHCSVMEFLPTQSLVTVGDEDKIKYENFFDGIEFDTEHVILKDDNGEPIHQNIIFRKDKHTTLEAVSGLVGYIKREKDITTEEIISDAYELKNQERISVLSEKIDEN